MMRTTVTSRQDRRSLLAAAAAAVLMLTVMVGMGWGQTKFPPISDDDLARITKALPEKATAEPARPRKLLIFCRCQGFVHGSIPYGNKALELMGKKTGAYESVVSDEMSAFDPGKLDGFDAVVFNNTTQLKFDDPARRRTLLEFVNAGKGICGIHAATDSFTTWPKAAAMMGGLFDGHPWGGEGTWAIKLDEPNHPLNKAFGGKGFWVHEEIYRIKDPYSREKLRVLASLDMSQPVNQPGSRPDNDNPISWIQQFGKARVFYCSLGHHNEIFWNPAVLQHYLDGIQFALGDLKLDATPSAKLPEKPEPALAPPSP